MKKRKPWKLVLVLAAVALAAGAAFAVFRGRESPPSAAQQLSNQRYCGLSSRLEGALAAAGVPTVGAVPPTVSAKAIEQALAEVGPEADELPIVAPAKVRDDVTAVLAAFRRAATGDAGGASGEKFTKAEERVAAFRMHLASDPTSGCGPGAGSGDS